MTPTLDTRFCRSGARRTDYLPFVATASLFLIVAVLLSPSSVLPRVPWRVNGLKPELLMGIQLTRLLLLVGAGFAVVSGWFHQRYRLMVGGETFRFRWKHSDLAIGAVLLSVASMVRLHGLSGSLIGDETLTLVGIVRRGLPAIVAWSAGANNHFLNSALTYCATQLFGETTWSVRLASFVIGAATPAVTYLVGITFLPRLTMLLTASLMTLQVHYIDYSGQSRGYAGFILFGILSSCLFRLLCQSPTRKVATSYVAASTLACGFLLPAICCPLTHVVAAAFLATREAVRKRAPERILHWRRVLILALWGLILGLLMNVLTIPQVLDYSRHPTDNVHIPMGRLLGFGILQYSTGAYRVTAVFVLLLAAAAGWFRYRKSPCLLIAVLGPPLAYLAGFTLVGLHGSPRLFLSLGFPVMLGLGMLAHCEWASRALLRRVAAVAVLGVFLIDAIPELLSYYHVGNPDLRSVAIRITPGRLLVAGEHPGVRRSLPNPATRYYFPESPWMSWNMDEGIVLGDLAAVDPQFIVFQTSRCPNGELKGVNREGYHEIERLGSWRNVYPVSDERGFRICYVIYGR